jgi:chromatin remodeling complex protein RSC6
VINVGEGILGKGVESDQKTNKNIEKANSLLDELSREEKSGFKAEI